MVTLQRQQTQNNLVSAGRIQQLGGEGVPNEISNQFMPTIEVNPYPTKIMNIIRQAGSALSGTQTAYTTPSLSSGKRCFLYAMNINLEKSALCNAPSCYLTAKNKTGENIYPFQLNLITGNASSRDADFVLPNPIELFPSSPIDITCTFAAGACSFGCTIVIYEIEY